MELKEELDSQEKFRILKHKLKNMKSKLELIPLAIFALNAVLSFYLENTEAALGWIVATMIQVRVIALIKKFDKEEEEK